jgi:uncharacterized protein (DUF362 family)
MNFSSRQVAVWQGVPGPYPRFCPFDPGPGNAIYRGVEQCLALAGLDPLSQGRPNWNPLGDCIAPGETVLLKPNWVKGEHPREAQLGPEAWESVVTHPSIVRAMADYCFRAVGRQGRVIVADAPQTDSSWSVLAQRLSLEGLRRDFARRGFELEIVDLRQEEWRQEDGVIVERRKLAGDPMGYAAFDLGAASELAGHPGAGRYYGADYDDREVNRHHSGGRHEYLLARTAVAADVVISLPKLKTHKKTGLTASLKNLVGVNGDKNWLPHHTECGWRQPGDERPLGGRSSSVRRLIERQGAAALRRATLRWPALAARLHGQVRRLGEDVFGATEEVIRSGNWSGNDTCWRMCLDLNKLVFYGRPDGTLRRSGAAARKRYLVLADGWIAGEGSGPMNPDPVHAAVLMFGIHPASVDAAACVLMGFDPDLVPLVRQAFLAQRHQLTEWGWRDVEIVSNVESWSRPIAEIDPEATFSFRPHFGWRGHLERRRRAGRQQAVLA